MYNCAIEAWATGFPKVSLWFHQLRVIGHEEGQVMLSALLLCLNGYDHIQPAAVNVGDRKSLEMCLKFDVILGGSACFTDSIDKLDGVIYFLLGQALQASKLKNARPRTGVQYNRGYPIYHCILLDFYY